jgi:hypothetical protein
MQSFIKAIDGLPLVAKIILCLFGLDIVWAIYRIVKGIDKKDNFLLIVGIIWLIGAISVAWIIDLVTVILNKDNPILT